MKITYQTRNIEQTVSFAGEELCRYLAQMLCEEEGVFSVSLAAADSVDAADAFHIEIGTQGGSIVGSNPRSVLLGVYDYLHTIGCRFLSPMKETEVIPSVTIQQLAAHYQKTASFKHRGVCIEGANSVENVLDFIDWLPKVGYNSFFLQFQIPYVFLSRWYHHEENPLRKAEAYTMEDAKQHMRLFEQELKKRALLLHKVGHGWTGEVLGSETVGSWDAVESAVEQDRLGMAAKVNGRRGFYMGIPANTNLCFSHPRTLPAFTELVVGYARQNPEVDYLHVWLADAYNNVCECEECGKTTISDQYIALLNEIDCRLAEEQLPTRVVFLLYQELLWPPVKERLKNPDRFLLMFAPISRTFERSYDLSEACEPIPSYVPNHIMLPSGLGENLSFLKGWQSCFSGEGFVYDYPLGRAHYGDFGYLRISRILAQDIKKLRELGLDGYVSCQELRVASPNMLPNYVMGRVLFDESADVEACIQEYCQAAYSSDVKLAKEYLERLSALNCCDYINGKGSRGDLELGSAMEILAEFCGQMTKKLKQTPDTPHWKALRHHNQYILRLARALAALACGSPEKMDRYRAMCSFLCETEEEFQPWLDVYRVIEVTKKYTGFQENWEE